MSSDRDMIAAMVAERVAQHVTAARSEIQAIAGSVMTLFEVHREAGWIFLTLAPVYPRSESGAQRPSQGVGRVFACTCGGPLGAMPALGESCPIHPEG